MINSDLKNLSKCIFIILVILINIFFSKNLYSSGDNDLNKNKFDSFLGIKLGDEIQDYFDPLIIDIYLQSSDYVEVDNKIINYFFKEHDYLAPELSFSKSSYDNFFFYLDKNKIFWIEALKQITSPEQAQISGYDNNKNTFKECFNNLQDKSFDNINNEKVFPTGTSYRFQYELTDDLSYFDLDKVLTFRSINSNTIFSVFCRIRITDMIHPIYLDGIISIITTQAELYKADNTYYQNNFISVPYLEISNQGISDIQLIDILFQILRDNENSDQKNIEFIPFLFSKIQSFKTQLKIESEAKKSKNNSSNSNNLSPRDRALSVIDNAKNCFINSNNKLFLKPYYDGMMEFLYEFSEVVGTHLDHAADSYLYNARIQAEFILDNENCL